MAKYSIITTKKVDKYKVLHSTKTVRLVVIMVQHKFNKKTI